MIHLSFEFVVRLKWEMRAISELSHLNTGEGLQQADFVSYNLGQSNV
jgi:hypothetical protein